jgi:hypothetical protein
MVFNRISGEGAAASRAGKPLFEKLLSRSIEAAG